ncbi:hypothetical protein P154DRAFT_572163 [Amniculicola lignicola CBS 123094]|uniref:F-box domain-containing protein n=1 Tax=Amniculicola lignicola CBS 123094 TaxID=1392246 RepID=A0A6A5WU87_9PLEO|nr:hypothetical protein P154DRAFT_572163 [Amniculicola lignicola CBS 123094]
MAHLTELPAEIISSICDLLAIDDVHELRTVCKDMWRKTRYSLLAKTFRMVPVMMTRASLQGLLDLAEDPIICGVIKELQIVLVTYLSERKDSLPLGPQRRSQRRAYSRHMHSQNTMRTTGEDVALLAQVLTKLTALESISTTDRLDPINPPLKAQDVHADLGMWPPVANMQKQNGWEMIGTWQEQYAPCRKQNLAFNTHVIAVVMGALQRTGKKLKGSLNFVGCPFEIPLPKHPDSRRLSPTGTPASTFNETQITALDANFSQLTELSLATFAFGSQDHSVAPRGVGDMFSWFHAFVPVWSNVTTLTITGSKFNGEERILSDLSGSAKFFPKLRSFSLISIQVHGQHLLRFAQHHASTLEHLTVHRHIIGSNYRELMRLLTRNEMIKFRSINLKLGDSRIRDHDFHSLVGVHNSTLILEERSHEDFVEVCHAVLHM